jgi:hypothetical protein
VPDGTARAPSSVNSPSHHILKSLWALLFSSKKSQQPLTTSLMWATSSLRTVRYISHFSAKLTLRGWLRTISRSCRDSPSSRMRMHSSIAKIL